MSLLEDALRRQAQRSGATEATAPGDGRRPYPSGMPREPGTGHGDPTPSPAPSPSHAAATPSPAVAAVDAAPDSSRANALRPAQLGLPIAILLLTLALAWFALRQGRLPTVGTPPGSSDAAQPIPRGASAASHPLPDLPLTPPTEDAATLPTEPLSAPTPAGPREDAVMPSVTNAVPESFPPQSAASERNAAAAHATTNAQPAARSGMQPTVTWPLFTVRGLATSGQETLVMLDTGEMLASGERSKTGVRVLRVTPLRAWFEWNGQTNGLRKGESSDRPLLD